MTRIELDNFETLINSIARLMGLPDDIREAILEGKLVKVNDETVTDFRFKKGETGSFSYMGALLLLSQTGLQSTWLTPSTIFSSSFLLRRLHEHTKKKKFLGFTTGKKVRREINERNLSTEEQERLCQNFMNKDIKGFKGEYAHLLEGPKDQHLVDEL